MILFLSENIILGIYKYLKLFIKVNLLKCDNVPIPIMY